MALIQCPECQQRVSDQAGTCPHCGYPLANSQQADLEPILCRGVWLPQSAGLVDAMLVAIFSPDHSFRGQPAANLATSRSLEACRSPAVLVERDGFDRRPG